MHKNFYFYFRHSVLIPMHFGSRISEIPINLYSSKMSGTFVRFELGIYNTQTPLR